jgi:nucleotide sugar dehydrogenase
MSQPAGFAVAVVGLGYVGMTLAEAAVAAGLRVVGYDTDPAVIRGLRAGRSHVDDVSHDGVRGMLANGFIPATDPDMLGRAEVVVICVPTPLSADGQPDLGAVRAACQATARVLRPGMLVTLESTSYPGTTEEVAQPLLEESGLRAGVDFHLAFSPERIDPGNRTYRLSAIPKIVGGVTPACTAAASSFYRRLVDRVVQASGTREAELAKIIENTYRQVNIALANELAALTHELGIDIWDAIDCAATKPFGFQPFYPGPGPGGHCIPVDPKYLCHKVRSEGSTFRLVELAQEINSRAPVYVVERTAALLNRARKAVNGSRVLLLGVTYKPNVADQRGSPAVEIARRLLLLDAAVEYHDPFVPEWSVAGERLPRSTDLVADLQRADVTVLLQDHAVYDPAEVAQHAKLLLDTRGCTRGVPARGVEVL